MPYLRIHRLTTGSVANGATKEDNWKSDAKYVLREVIITSRGNSALTNVQFYADIDGVPLFRPDVPAVLLNSSNITRLQIMLPFNKGSSFNYKLTNNSGAAETYDISLILLTDTWPPS